MVSENPLPVSGGYHMTDVLPLLSALSQDAFSPRRRGMDRRPLSEGFDVRIPFMRFFPSCEMSDYRMSSIPLGDTGQLTMITLKRMM